MKVSFLDDEILVDLTKSHLKKSEGNKEIVISKTNFLIPVFKGMPKSFHYYNRNKVNPYSISCTCKQFRDNVKLYPVRDIRRVCKHIFFILTKNFESRLDELTRLLLEHQFWDKIIDVYEIIFNEEKLFISFSKEKKFIRVYRKNSHWKFYTYLFENKSWIDDIPPFKDTEQNEFFTAFLNQLYSEYLK